MSTLVMSAPTAALTGGRPVAPGDAFDSPIMLMGDGATVVLQGWGGGPEPTEPGIIGHRDESIWLDYIANESGTLEITASEDMRVEIGSGESVDAFIAFTSGNPHGAPVSVLTGANSPVKIRVRPYLEMAETLTLAFTWENLVPDLILEVLSDLRQAPGTFRATVSNGDPDATVSFTDSAGNTIPDVDLDEEGRAISIAIPITSLVQTAGTYTLTASAAGRDDATADYVQLVDAPTDPLEQPADADPVDPGLINNVRKWTFQDPAPGGEQYIFHISPDSMTDPFSGNEFTLDGTTAPDGQILTWEGARKAVDWSFKGTILHEAQYEAFERFAALNRRVYLIDHRGRAWVVSVEAFDPVPKRVLDNDWAHTYTVFTKIYKGPVELVIP